MPPAAGGQPSRASEAQASDYHDHIVHIVMAVKGAGLCLRLRLRHGTVTVIGGHHDDRNGSYSTMPKKTPTASPRISSSWFQKIASTQYYPSHKKKQAIARRTTA